MCMKYNVITNNRPIFLGRVGENGVTTIRFPINIFFPFVGATDYRVSLWHQRDGDLAPYPVALDDVSTDRSREYVDWKVNLADVAKPGNGIAQLTAWVDEHVAKTVVFTTVVADSMGLVDPPAAVKPWTDQVAALAESARDSAENAAVSASQAMQARDNIANLSVRGVPLADNEQVYVEKQVVNSASGDFLLQFGLPAWIGRGAYNIQFAELLMQVLDKLAAGTDPSAELDLLRDLITPHGAVTNMRLELDPDVTSNILDEDPSNPENYRKYFYVVLTYADNYVGRAYDFNIVLSRYTDDGLAITVGYLDDYLFFFQPFPVTGQDDPAMGQSDDDEIISVNPGSESVSDDPTY